jgi:hypothetical protein
VSLLPAPIQYNALNPSRIKKVRERNEKDINGKGKSQIIPVCR